MIGWPVAGDAHELLPQRTGHDPPGGDGVAAGDDVLQVLHQVGEERLEVGDLLLEAGQGRLVAGRWVVVGQAWVGELVDGRLVGRAERVLEARDDLDVAGHCWVPLFLSRWFLILGCAGLGGRHQVIGHGVVAMAEDLLNSSVSPCQLSWYQSSDTATRAPTRHRWP